jgi:hypothetical protein
MLYRGSWSQPAGKLPVVGDRNWPALTAHLSTTNGGNEMLTGRRELGRPLYVALLPVGAGTWLALDDPLLTD